MYIRIAFSIELRLRVSRSLRSLAIHPSSNTLISTEQRGGVRNKYIYIYIYICICNSTGRSEIRDKFHEC